MTNKPLINPELYKKINETMPITAIDIILVKDGKFLLGKRNNKPVQNKWWLPGGRILKGELLKNAVKRKVKEETGYTIKNSRLLTVTELFFPDSVWKTSTHNIILLYKAEAKQQTATPDKQHAQLTWFLEIDKRWPKYIRWALELAGFKYHEIVSKHLS